ncbi:MAG TPA: flagellar basal body-associated FliL family protein [Cellvibrionaceae bacterium]
MQNFLLLVFLAGGVLTERAYANSGGAAEGAAGAVYVSFKPALVTNYGGAGRIKYVKADMSVRVESAAVADSVQHNMPLIRNNLLNIMAKQTDETLSGQPGKEAMRQEALKEIQAIIKQQSDLEGVMDLYFNSIVVQK